MSMITRFRRPDRDQQTDDGRNQAVRLALLRARRSLEQERKGLDRRLEEARLRAASLLGNESGIYFEREPEDEQMLSEAEAQMAYASRRLADLRTQYLAFSNMLAALPGPSTSFDRRHSLRSRIAGGLYLLYRRVARRQSRT